MQTAPTIITDFLYFDKVCAQNLTLVRVRNFLTAHWFCKELKVDSSEDSSSPDPPDPFTWLWGFAITGSPRPLGLGHERKFQKTGKGSLERKGQNRN